MVVCGRMAALWGSRQPWEEAEAAGPWGGGLELQGSRSEGLS